MSKINGRCAVCLVVSKHQQTNWCNTLHQTNYQLQHVTVHFGCIDRSLLSSPLKSTSNTATVPTKAPLLRLNFTPASNDDDWLGSNPLPSLSN